MQGKRREKREGERKRSKKEEYAFHNETEKWTLLLLLHHDISCKDSANKPNMGMLIDSMFRSP